MSCCGRGALAPTNHEQRIVAIDKDVKIYVAGHRDTVGSAIVRRLRQGGYTCLITRTQQELDLLEQRAVFDFLDAEKPEYIFMAAAKVGGIHANNTYRADFTYENLTAQNNLIHGALKPGAKDLCFLGSSCIYPLNCPRADQGGIPAHRPAGANQRILRHRQDRRHQAMRKLQPLVRPPLLSALC